MDNSVTANWRPTVSAEAYSFKSPRSKHGVEVESAPKVRLFSMILLKM